jgi:glycosidase
LKAQRIVKLVIAITTAAGFLLSLLACGMAFNPIDAENMMVMNSLINAGPRPSGPPAGMTTRNGGGDEIILQAWHWGSASKTPYNDPSVTGGWYNFITEQIQDIKDAGFTVLYLPPPWRDDSHWSDENGGEGGGEGYYWRSQSLDSRYGTQADLQDLIDAAELRDIKVIFDMVPNHNDKFNQNGVDFLSSYTNPTSFTMVNVKDYTILGKTSPSLANELHYFDTRFTDLNGTVFSGFNPDEPDGAADNHYGTTTAYGSDMNMFTPYNEDSSARNNNGEGFLAIQRGMQQLADMGAAGWRWDYVHGYPSTHVDAWINEVGNQEISIGEYAEDNYNTLLSWASGDDNGTNSDDSAATGGANSAVFDFLLKRSFKDNEYTPNNWGGLLTDVYGHNRERAVTFVKNHDTDNSPGSGVKDTRAGHLGIGGYDIDISQAHKMYAFILLMPGTPCVYFPDYYGDYPGQKQNDWAGLIGARKESGIMANSYVEKYNDQAKWYVWDNPAGSGDPTLAFSIDTDWNPNNDKSMSNTLAWNANASDWPNGIRVWNRVSGTQATTTTTVSSGTTTTLASPGTIRTVIFMKMQTQSGQDMYMKGGHDGDLYAAGHYSSMSEPITYNNTLDQTTYDLKMADDYLDWSPDWSALNWTTGKNSGYHANNNLTYELVGYGYDPELRNVAGKTDDHWWKFDVNMDGSAGDWYEFKGFLNGGQGWESDINQSGTPYTSRNHWGKKGYITVCEFNQDWVEFHQL